MQQADVKEWWSRIITHPFFWFFAPIATALGIPGALATFTSGSLELAFSVGVIAPVAVVLSVFTLRNRTTVRLATQAERPKFFPFKSEAPTAQQEATLLGHQERVLALKDKLNGKGTITLLVGESGVGKSTLLIALVNEGLARRFEAENSAAEVCEQIRQFIATPEGKATKIIAVDQAERFRNSLMRDPTGTRKLFDDLEEALRSRNKKLLFAIRSDLLSPILKALTPLGVNLHFQEGLGFEKGSQALESVLAHLDGLSLSDAEQKKIISDLVEANTINSLAFQTACYLIECLSYQQRKKHFSNVSFDRGALSVYLELIYRQYANKWLYSDYLIHIETVLYTVSVFNRRHCLPITQEEIAQATSMAPEYVEEAAQFLEEFGILDRTSATRPSYFVAHDLIIAEVVDNQPRYMRQDYRLAISEILNRRDTIRDLPVRHKEVGPFVRVFTAVSTGPFAFSLALVSIWVATLSYSFRLNSPEVAQYLVERAPSFVLALSGGIDIPLATLIFFPIAFTLYCWIIFIYGLDRGYFYYLWKEGAISTVAYLLVHVAGSIGIVIGFFSSVAPVLFLYGVILPGMLIAVAHASAWYRAQDRTSLFARYSIKFVWQTLLNMVISVSASYLIVRVVSENVANGRVAENVVILCWICVVYSLFAFAMRERQGSESGHWVLLSIYASSRLRGKG